MRANQRGLAVIVALHRLCGQDGANARYHFHRNSVGEICAQRDLVPVALPGGDLFVLDTTERGGLAAAIEGSFASDGGHAFSSSGLIATYRVPQDYLALRAHIQSYLEDGDGSVGGDGSGNGDGSAAGHARQGGDREGEAGSERQPAAPLRGRLTPAMLVELEARLDAMAPDEIMARQVIWTGSPDWTKPVWVETRVRLDRLRDHHFPDVHLDTGEPLVAALAMIADRRVLEAVGAQTQAGRIGLNLALSTLKGDAWAAFDARLTPERKASTVIEIDWLDVLRARATGDGALSELTRKGYKLAIDHLGVDALRALDPDMLRGHFVKLLYEHGKLPLWAEARTTELLRGIGPSRLVLTGCDHPSAISVAERLGIAMMQGRLLDQRAAERHEEPAAARG